MIAELVLHEPVNVRLRRWRKTQRDQWQIAIACRAVGKSQMGLVRFQMRAEPSQSQIQGLKRVDPESRCCEGDGEAVNADPAGPPGWSGWFGREDAGDHACSGTRVPEKTLSYRAIGRVRGHRNWPWLDRALIRVQFILDPAANEFAHIRLHRRRAKCDQRQGAIPRRTVQKSQTSLVPFQNRAKQVVANSRA